MKTFTIVNKDDRKSLTLAKYIRKALEGYGHLYDVVAPELVICVGGDGTILHAIHQWMDQIDHINIIGIHTGTLGFYTEYESKEVDEMIEAIVHDVPRIEHKKLLKAECSDAFQQTTYLALNEIRIESITRTQKIDVYVNQKQFEHIKGNGVCVCGPSGSTAYNRSANGSIIWEGLDVLQLTELNGLHHRLSRSLQNPLILPTETLLTFRSDEHYPQAYLCFDHLYQAIDGIKEIKIGFSDQHVKFAHYRNIPFEKRLTSLF